MNRYFLSLGFLFLLLVTISTRAVAQITVGSKDCSTATQLCNNDVIDDQLISQTNRIGFNDVPVSYPSCFAPKTERNPFWYQFSPENNGTFEMYLNATVDKDFDFIIFDISDGCPTKTVLQCNTSQLDLDSNFIGTGISTDSLNKYETNFPGIQNSWMPTLNVTTGKRYAIYIESRQLVRLDTFQVTFGGSAKFRNIDAKFIANAPFCFGKPVVFTNQTTGAGTITYAWDFGDGKTSSQINPVHVYTTPGSYMVKLVAGNGKCAYEDSLLIDIPITIVANAGADVPVCSGKSVSLNATGGTIYSWSPAAGLSNPNIANPIASPTVNTAYTVTVSDAQGCKGTDLINVAVNANPIVDAGNDVSICTSDSVQLNASGAVTYSWSPSIGLSDINVANPFAKPLINSSYIVTGTDALGCTAQDLVSITLKTLPNVNAGQDVNICNGKSTLLAATGGVSYSWLPISGLSNASIAAPTAAPNVTTNYIVTATGLNGCKNTDNVIVTIDPLPNANAGTDAIICQGASTALTASGGLGYSWSPATGLSNSNISNPTATPNATTIYTVTVTDAKGCVHTDDIEVTVNAIPLINAGVDAVLCSGDSVQINAVGATNYSWSPSIGLSNPNVSNPLAKPLVTTSYIVIGDNGGCPNSDTIIVAVNTKPIANAGADVSVCNGKPAQLVATGGTAYIWTPTIGLSNANIANPIASSTVNTKYTVTVTGGNGCVATDDVQVSVAPNPIANAGLDIPICQGSNTTLNASGGVSYSWSPATGLSNVSISNPIANPIATTTYTVTVTDAGGCQASDDIDITVNTLPTIDAGVDNIICTGDSAQLNASGASTYTWSPVSTLTSSTIANPIAFPITTTTYIVQGNNGICSNTDSVKITVKSLPTASAGADASVCNGKPASLVATGGVTYSWSPIIGLSNSNIANPIATPSAVTNFTVTVTGANGCKATDVVQVSVAANPIANAGLDIPICQGSNTTLNASGGVSYSWSPATGLSNVSISNPIANPIATTTYTVTVTDAGGCQASDDIDITVNTLPTIDAGVDNIICTGDSAQLNASGASTYTWSPVSTLTNSTIANPIAFPITTTTYIVQGNNGICSNTDSVKITVKSLPTASAGADASVCNGKPASLVATGGVTYSWSPIIGLSNSNIANPIATPSAVTNYTVTVTGANGCKATDVVQVSVAANPIANAGLDAPICKGTGTALNASGGVSYSWLPAAGLSNSTINNPIANPVVTTTYTVTVTDAGGCQATDDIDITVNILPTIDAGVDNIICTGDSTQLLASGATSYIWSPVGSITAANVANPFAFPVATTTYIVQGNNGVCSNTDSVKITVKSLPTASAGADASVCNGKPASLVATGGVTYSWSPIIGLSNPNIANPVATPVVATNYTVTVIGVNGCKATDVVQVSVAANPIANAGLDAPICKGTGTALNASGGITYNWSPASGLSNSTINNPLANPLITTLYTVTVTDAAGCKATDDINITVNAVPTVNAGVDKTICASDSTQLSASGATSYIWSPAASITASNISNPIAFPLATTTYVVQGSNGICTNIDSVKIFVNPLPNGNAGVDVSVCNGKPANLSAIGGVSYSWSPITGLSNPNIANPIANPAATTNYTVTIVGINSCKAKDNVLVSITTNPTVVASTINDKICLGTGTSLNATGGSSYSWSPAAGLSNATIATPTASPIVTTKYKVLVTDGGGCQGTDSLTITVNNLPNVNAGIDDSTCVGIAVPLTATGALSYSWTPNASLSADNIANPMATPLANTNYTVTGTDPNGCKNTDQILVKITNGTPVDAGQDATFCFGKNTTLTATGIGNTYTWSPASGLSNPNILNPIATPTQTTKYMLSMTDSKGCTNIDSVIVNVNYIAINVSNDTVLCSSTSLPLSASGGTTYLWTPATGLSNPNIANPIATLTGNLTFRIDITDDNGCKNFDSVKVTVSTIPVVTTSNDTTVCNGNSATLNASGGITYAWLPSAGLSNPGIANPVATPSITTKYIVTVSGVNGCTQKDTVDVNVTFIAITASNDTSVCFGKPAKLLADGGTVYSWSPITGLDNPNSATPLASPTFTTDYMVTVTDANGCKNTENVKVNVSYIATSVSNDTAFCRGASANLIASGGVNYIWSPNKGLSATNIANPNASPDSTTKYYVITKDITGCQNIDSVLVSINQLPKTNAGKDSSICNGNSVNLMASGALSYSWLPVAGLSNSSIANPVAAPNLTTQYVVTATDAVGCSQKDSVTIGVNFINILVSADTAMCLGQTASLVSAGGTIYNWLPAAGLSNTNIANPKANPLISTKYKVTITDAQGCKNEDSVAVTVNTLPIANAGIDQSICLGRSTILTATGGSGYNWSPASTLTNPNIANPTAEPVITTKYAVIVTDANGCINTDTVTVNITNGVGGTATATPDTFCSGSPITLNAIAGNGVTLAPSPYSFDGGKTFQPANFLNLLSVIEDTTAHVMLKDNTGCLSDTILINLVRKLFSATVTQLSPVTCAGLSNGIAQISNIKGGSKPYSFYTGTNAPVADSVFRNLNEGTQILFIKDQQACISKYSIKIDLNPSIANTISKKDAKCFAGADGEVTVVATGGSGLGFKYSFDGGVFGIINQFKNVSTGLHKIVIRDSLTCFDSVSVNIGSPTALSIEVPSAPVNVTCFGGTNGSIVFTASGGITTYQYGLASTLFQNDSLFANLQTGAYNGFVMDANGCKDSINFSIKSPDSLRAAIRILQQPLCSGLGGILVLDSINGGTPAYKKIVNGESPTLADTLKNFLPGSHQITISDKNGCERIYDISFNADTNAISGLSLSDSTTCFSSSGGKITLTNLQGGIKPYRFSLGDTLTYQSDSIYKNLVSGTYKIFAKNANNCLSQFTAKIGEPEEVNAKILTQENITCFGKNDGTVTIEGLGGRGQYNYSIDNQIFTINNVFTNLVPGRDTIYVADKNMCKGTLVVNIATPDSISTAISQTKPSSCEGGDGEAEVTLASGGTGLLQYSIDRGISYQTNSLFTKLNSGVYTMLIKDANLCSKKTDFTIKSVPEGLDVAAIKKNTTDIACKSVAKGAVVLSNFVGAPAPYVFALDTLVNFTRDSAFSNLNQGLHVIKIKDGNQCNYQISVTIEKPDTISFTVEIVKLETCTNSDGQVAITNVIGGSGKYSYKLDKTQASPIFVGLNKGLKTITVLDSMLATCASTINIDLGQKAGPVAYTTKFDPLCYNQDNGMLRIDSIKGGLAPYKFSLDNDVFSSDLKFENLPADTMTLYVKDSECNAAYVNMEMQIKLDSQNKPDTAFVPYFVLNKPERITAESNFYEDGSQDLAGITEIFNIRGGTKPYTYSLNDTLYQKIVKDTVQINGLKEGTYTIFLKDTNTCKEKMTINVGKSFKIPNLFSPNGDGKNDYFEITGLRNKSTFTVVNRWGTQVYFSKNYDNTWDASDCEDGIYYYEIVIPKMDTYKGWIQIARGK